MPGMPGMGGMGGGGGGPGGEGGVPPGMEALFSDPELMAAMQKPNVMQVSSLACTLSFSVLLPSLELSDTKVCEP